MRAPPSLRELRAALVELRRTSRRASTLLNPAFVRKLRRGTCAVDHADELHWSCRTCVTSGAFADLSIRGNSIQNIFQRILSCQSGVPVVIPVSRLLVVAACVATLPFPAAGADASITNATSEFKSDWTPAPDEYYSSGTEATEQTGPVQPADVDVVGKSAPRDLATRMGVLILGKDAGSEATINHPEMVQETLKMVSETPAMWNRSPTHRISCWLAAQPPHHGPSVHTV